MRIFLVLGLGRSLQGLCERKNKQGLSLVSIKINNMQRKEFLKNFGLGTMLIPMLTSCSEDESIEEVIDTPVTIQGPVW